MTEPTERFTGLAELYSSSRPGYPDAAIDHIFKSCSLNEQSTIADIGCGTGISSRLMFARNVQVIGVEPNDDMRLQAENKVENAEFAAGKLRYLKGDAENTNLSSNSVRLVLAAQAFHWFNPKPTIVEFCRILSRPGWIALMWNERDSADAFTNEYGKLLLSFPETKNVEMNRGKAGIPLLESELVKDATVTYFKNSQQLDLNGLSQRAFSSSYAPKESPDKDVLEAGLQDIFFRYQSGGTIILRYETSVYLAQAI